VRAYFLTLQYWLAGSEDNIVNLVCCWSTATPPARASRCAPRPARAAPRLSRTRRLPPAITTRRRRPDGHHAGSPPKVATGTRGTVGLLLMRSYLLAGNADHYDGVIAALKARGLRVIPAFAPAWTSAPRWSATSDARAGRASTRWCR
jgi:magnesium chelatase subunit H